MVAYSCTNIAKMGMCPPRKLATEKHRKILLQVICLFHMLMILVGVILLLAGLKVLLFMKEMDFILAGKYNGAAQYTLILVGSFIILAHSVMAQKSFKWSDWKTRPSTQFPYFMHKIVVFILMLAIVIAASLCLYHRGQIRKAFYKGIKVSMGQYKSEIKAKMEIDTMQIAYKCCGGRDFRDWFQISWIKKSVVNIKDPDIAK